MEVLGAAAQSGFLSYHESRVQIQIYTYNQIYTIYGSQTTMYMSPTLLVNVG